MRVGVIGCGSIGTRHAWNARNLGHEVHVFDADNQKAHDLAIALCRAGNGHTVNGSGMPPDWIEAVLICTPAHTHTSVLLQLRDAGYGGPLFVEKPICDTLVDAEHWRAWPHVCTQVGYNLRFHQAAQTLRAHVTEPTGGQFFLDCDSRDWPGATYASMLLECSHEIDLALFCGAPTTVIDKGNYLDEHDISFWLGPNWYVAIRDRMDRYHRQWTLTRRGAEASAFFYAPKELGDQMYRDEIAHFLECAQRGVPTKTPFADGLRVLDVIDQAQRLNG